MSPNQKHSHKHNTNTNNNIFSYLEQLSRKSLLSLYKDPTRGQYAAKTILQKLPDLAKQIIIRLAVCGGSFPLTQLLSWANSKCTKEAKLILTRMEKLCVLEPLFLLQSLEDGNTKHIDNGHGNIPPNSEVRLTKEFHEAIGIALTSLQATPWKELSQSELTNLCNTGTTTSNTTTSDLKSQSAGTMMLEEEKPPTLLELETYTQKRWDSVLHFLVGTDTPDIPEPPRAVIYFLEETGLMQPDPDWKKSSAIIESANPNNIQEDNFSSSEAPLVITSKGYEFMLNDVNVQVWSFILQYFSKLSEQQKANSDELQKEAILFLLCLSYCHVGSAYPASVLSKNARVLMKDFAHFGLLYVCKLGGTTVFYPTRVAVHLVVASLSSSSVASSSSSGNDFSDGLGVDERTTLEALSSSSSATRALEIALSNPIPSSHHIAIIVQTNFQVCAYTTSPLHVSMLGLFCDVTNFRRMPNIILYRMTRDSVKSAFKLGIQASQILRFLKMHAHPRLRTGDQPLIPSNVEDQIILWDRERSRVRLEEVYIMQCHGLKEYLEVKDHAIITDAFAWGHEGQNRLMIKYDKAEMMVAFLRRWRSKVAQRQAAENSGDFH